MTGMFLRTGCEYGSGRSVRCSEDERCVTTGADGTGGVGGGYGYPSIWRGQTAGVGEDGTEARTTSAPWRMDVADEDIDGNDGIGGAGGVHGEDGVT